MRSEILLGICALALLAALLPHFERAHTALGAGTLVVGIIVLIVLKREKRILRRYILRGPK